MSLTSPRGRTLEELEGSAGTMGSWVGAFDRAAKALETGRRQANRATELPGAGDAVSKARRDAGAILDHVRPGILQAELLSRTLSAYADAFSASAVPANRMIDEIEAAHAAASRAAAEADHAGRGALAAARSASTSDAEMAAADAEARDAINARDTAQSALDELWRTWDQLYTDWDDAYDAALSALAGGVQVAWVTREERELLDALVAADDPAAVLKLWDEADEETRKALRKAYPDVIGNLDGIPYDVRAEVNGLRLIERIQSNPTDQERRELLILMDEIRKGGKVISFDPDGSGQTTAAVWYGEFDATKVNVLVPGMVSEVSQMGEWGVSARDLNRSVGGNTATVAWFGYDSPNYVEEPFMSRAQNGAPALRSFLLGLDAQHGERTTTVVAHSYGSTTSALAIGSAADGLGVDKFITLGSAGLPDDDAVLANLQSPDAPRVYVTQSDNDFWSPVGKALSWGHHTQPSTLDGATTFDSDGGVDASGRDLLPTPGHSTHSGANFPGQSVEGGYLQDGSEAFYNISRIIDTGEPGTEHGGQGSEDGFWTLVAKGYAEAAKYGY
ncbi:MAG: alpha/beta hydrolase family protein [Microbacterium sp.]|jgi:hypothetical protein|nr:alpha/beta hydrolase family protein [Microbacterium sp.]